MTEPDSSDQPEPVFNSWMEAPDHTCCPKDGPCLIEDNLTHTTAL